MADITSFSGVSGTFRTASELLGIIEKIDLEIYNLVNGDINDATNFKAGDHTVTRSEYLKWLLDCRKTYARQLASLPAWETTVYDDPNL